MEEDLVSIIGADDVNCKNETVMVDPENDPSVLNGGVSIGEFTLAL